MTPVKDFAVSQAESKNNNMVSDLRAIVNALKVVYAAEGTDIAADYAKVFPSEETKIHGDDDVLEVGENGVDISG